MSLEISLGDILKRVSNWNSKRYERQYDRNLSVNLIAEELQEYMEATTDVDRLDALCDTVYVALGILWKINVDDEVLEYNADESNKQVARLLETNTFEPVQLAFTVLQAYKYDKDYPVALAAQLLITLCMTQMSMMYLSHTDKIEALLVVCDSNDSKSIKKTAAHIKANDGDKGPYFTPPEARLGAILDRVRNEHGY